MKDTFHIQVKDKLFGEDWLKCFAAEILDAKYEKTDVAEVMKGLTHLKCTSKSRLALSATGEQKGVWWNSWWLSTYKGTHWHWSKCQVCAFYALPNTLNPFESFQKVAQPSCWTRCLSTTTREWMGVILIQHSKEGQQSMLDQWLMSTEQSHKT